MKENYDQYNIDFEPYAGSLNNNIIWILKKKTGLTKSELELIQ